MSDHTGNVPTDIYFSPGSSVAIEGPAGSGKTRLLVQRARQWIEQDGSCTVLVLCSNYYRKDQFLQRLQSQLPDGCWSQLNIATYSGLVKDVLERFWPFVEQSVVSRNLGGRSVIFPQLTGFECTEYMLQWLLRQGSQTQPLFKDLNDSTHQILRQLIRLVRLKAENRLSHQEMTRRSQLIGQPCIEDVEWILKAYDKLGAQLRVLDNSRQIEAFHYLLDHDPSVQAYFKTHIRHLIVDDVDETVPAQQHFVKWLTPQVETLTMAADLEGGTRRGYLNAYPYDWPGLKALKPDIHTVALTRTDAFYQAAERLRLNWIGWGQQEPQTLPIDHEAMQWHAECNYRHDMLEQVILDVTTAIQQGRYQPGELVIVMPEVDPIARLTLQQHFRQRGIAVQLLTGTHRPADNPHCRGLLLLLQLANRLEWQVPLSPMEFRVLLRTVLKLHYLDSAGLETLVEHYRQSLPRQGFSFLPLPDALNPEARIRYDALLAWLSKAQGQPIEEQIYSGLSHIIMPYLTLDDDLADVQQVLKSLVVKDLALQLAQHQDPCMAARAWVLQLKHGVVADTPSKPTAIQEDAIVIGTPQKIIDYEIRRPVQCWLDMTSREWSRTDNAPLYNAWVHSVNWDGDTTQLSDAFNQQLTQTRAAHITRTLMLYAQQHIWLYASTLDNEGNPNTGVFNAMVPLPHAPLSKPIQRAVLRPDQAPILDYQSGPMAITAVPGAGKTFVNVELILSLIERGIAPDSILVLTYMDSAAKTLMARLKAKLGYSGGGRLPVISTIHSLAFRIITEHDHGLYLGLNTDQLQIIDDFERLSVVEQALTAHYGYDQHPMSAKAALKGIDSAKAYRLSPADLKQRQGPVQGASGAKIAVLIKVYEAYKTHLEGNGQLDFTDLILLAIDLLEQRPDVQEKYNRQFQIVIEDEAQDSSHLLQTLIDLLTRSHGNLIRTGDTNQSITTTFSSAETRVFRDFIALCQQKGQVVSMTCSSRCAQAVMDLANGFVDWACQDPILKDAFQRVHMQPVASHNPSMLYPLQAFLYEQSTDEEQAILSHIKSIQAQNPETGIAVLVRSNMECQHWLERLTRYDIAAVTPTDYSTAHPVFLALYWTLCLLENPADARAMTALLKQLEALDLCPSAARLTEQPQAFNLLSQHPSSIDDPTLLQLYYHLQELMSQAITQDVCALTIRLTDLLFTSAVHRNIGYLCALKAKELVQRVAASGLTETLHTTYLEVVIAEFAKYAERNQLPFKGAHSLLESSPQASSLATSLVTVMTLHKSKGQEFDMVFMPGLTESNFPSDPQRVRWDESDRVELALDQLRSHDQAEFDALMAAKKLKKIEEEARLVYVGVTRARRGLFVSCSRKLITQRGKPHTQLPSRYFEALSALLPSIQTNPSTQPEALTHA